MLKSITILILAAWNLHEYIPPVPDPLLGALVGMVAGLFLVAYMLIKASQLQPAPQPVRIHRQAQRRKPVAQPARQRYPANWPLAGQMALQGA